MNDHETIDLLSRTLRIIQHRSGHRAASDDIFLAWAAMRACPEARRILDLGSGKGTVALLLLRGLPAANVVGVEAHPAHHSLALRNAALNGLTDRYDARLGDLRDLGVLDGQPAFDLICGAPPYVRVGSGVLPKDPGRAAGRFELRGGVEDYARTAARHLTPCGRAVLLMNGPGRERAVSTAAANGLAICRLVAVRPRPGLPTTYWVIECAAQTAGPVVEEEICMRPETGMKWSAEYSAIRALLDLP
ncbi:MAG: methyltransferase domain-containing protein [Acidobacteria bacterium]|nr:MAG: methyltransferase domain-containing protein [Acidobacteriota bacterium]